MTAIGIAYELGSNKDTPFGLRPALLDFDGREAFWDNLRDLADSDTIDSVMLHRLYGEPVYGDYFDFDSRHQIEQSGDTTLTDYAKHMTRELIRFARDYRQLRIDLYIGSLRQIRMAFLLESGQAGEWMRRFWYELEVPRMLIAEGCNIRIVFDHASGFSPNRPEWYVIYQLSRMLPGRVVIESVPETDTPQRSLPAFAMEDHYAYLVRTDPDRANHPNLTRMTHDPHRLMGADAVVAFVADCLERGHSAIVADTELRRNQIELAEVVRRAHDAGRPQGVSE